MECLGNIFNISIPFIYINGYYDSFIISVTWMRGAMVARWIPVPKVACSIHVAFSHSFCLFLVKVTSKPISPLHDRKKRILY